MVVLAMSRPTGALRAIVAAMALFVVACGSAGTASLPSDTQSALEGEFAALDGSSVDLAELRGQDVVLWFWAPW